MDVREKPCEHQSEITRTTAEIHNHFAIADVLRVSIDISHIYHIFITYHICHTLANKTYSTDGLGTDSVLVK